MSGPRAYTPFEIDAGPGALAAIDAGIVSFAPIFDTDRTHEAEPRASMVWLKDGKGELWAVYVNQRDLEFKFEVFSLTIRSEAALRAMLGAGFRGMAPPQSAEFRLLPFDLSRTDILRRVEYIDCATEIGDALGENPIWQSAIPPSNNPKSVDAYCNVVIGIIFSGPCGERLLVAADWFPFDMIVTDNPAYIDEFFVSCEPIPVSDYAEVLRNASKPEPLSPPTSSP